MENIIDKYILETDYALKPVNTFYISNEEISIIENAGKIGLPLPQKLKDVIAQLNKDGKNQKAIPLKKVEQIGGVADYLLKVAVLESTPSKIFTMFPLWLIFTYYLL